MKKIFIVIPTIRDLDFLKSWGKQFSETTIIVCEDRVQKSVRVPNVSKDIFHYSWKEIDQELGENSWIIPRKVSAIRNFGFLKAYQMGADVIVTLDDDCYPVRNHHLVNLHLRNLSLTAPKNWINTYPDARFMYTRGMPYLNRAEIPIMVSHGLWTNALDLDAPTHLQELNFRAKFAEHFLQIIPANVYYPMCSMNLAFKREMTPLMYFPLMGEDKVGKPWGYDRFDDIWAGIFSKKIMDHLGYGVINGSPFVEHRKASDPFTNLKKEAAGIETNEELWKAIDQIKLTQKNPQLCYIDLANRISKINSKYFKNLSKAMIVWASLFNNS